MISGNRFAAGLGRELAYFSGLARVAELRTRGSGAILAFDHVQAPRRRRFQARRTHEIAPEALERTVGALRRWKFDIVPLDEFCQRATQNMAKGRFVALTFDAPPADFATTVYPVLAKLHAPFTVYLPTAFLDGLGEAWWLALGQVIAHHDRISLLMDERERHFSVAADDDKQQLYDHLVQWMRTLTPPQRSVVINDLCSRYAVDLKELSRAQWMNWSSVAELAADPLVTFGSATVNYAVLTALDDASASREMRMGRAVAEAALERDVRHFAYPFGDRNAFGPQHVRLAREAGFVSAVSAMPGLIRPGINVDLLNLPRMRWDGRQSLRGLRVMLSGIMGS